jgi:hypothetical protein
MLHGVQALLPVVAEYWPAAQPEHAEPSALYVGADDPAGQLPLHSAVAPVVVEYFPRGQLLQEMVALLPTANRWKRGWSTRPLRPSADPVPVICVVDEREPEVQKAPVNAAWMLRPCVGEAPRASEALLQRAREGAEPAAAKPVEPVRAATVSWAPPARLEAAAPARVTRSESPDLMSSAEAPEATNPIRVAMDAPARGGWPTSSRAMNIVLWIGVAGLLGAAAWWLLRGPAA